MYETPTHDKEEINRGTALERYVEKLLGGGGFNQFYSQKKPRTYSDAAPNYKYTFSPHKVPLPQ